MSLRPRGRPRPRPPAARARVMAAAAPAWSREVLSSRRWRRASMGRPASMAASTTWRPASTMLSLGAQCPTPSPSASPGWPASRSILMLSASARPVFSRSHAPARRRIAPSWSFSSESRPSSTRAYQARGLPAISSASAQTARSEARRTSGGSCSAVSGSAGPTPAARRRTSSARALKASMSLGSSMRRARSASSRGASAGRDTADGRRAPTRCPGFFLDSKARSRSRRAMPTTISATSQARRAILPRGPAAAVGRHPSAGGVTPAEPRRRRRPARRGPAGGL